MKLHPRFRHYSNKTFAGASLAAIFLNGAASLRAAEHQVSNGQADDVRRLSGTKIISMSGGSFLLGAVGPNLGPYRPGGAYLFRDVATATGTTTEAVTLNPSTTNPATLRTAFAASVALSGDYGLVGAPTDQKGVSGGPVIGSAYFYKGLGTATGTVTEDVRLVATDTNTFQFGQYTALEGDTALVGAISTNQTSAPGALYVYRGLASASGTVSQNAKLMGSDITTLADYFGRGTSMAGNMAIVGASGKTVGGIANQGAAYLFRNIGTATGTVFENAKLIASDGQANDLFGEITSFSADGTALVRAQVGSSIAGAVYLYRNLGSATGIVTENAKLVGSDTATGDRFGSGIGRSGNNAIVGASGDDDGGSATGSAYIYTNIGTATGTVTEAVKITASDAAATNQFGLDAAIEGDLFAVVAGRGDGAAVDSGKIYSGTVSSLTVFDHGNTTGVIGGISFESRQNWVIGRNTDNNTVVLSVGDTANVTTVGTSVEIGDLSGSNGNQLVIAGNLEATQVNIGVESIGGNNNNSLRFENTATFDIGEIRLTPGDSLNLAPAGHNFLIIEQQVDEINALLAYLGATDFLGTIDGGATYQQITTANYSDLIRWDYSVTNAGATTIWLIPEPSTAALGVIGAGFAMTRRRRASAVKP